jgi:hypothetical protein
VPVVRRHVHSERRWHGDYLLAHLAYRAKPFKAESRAASRRAFRARFKRRGAPVVAARLSIQTFVHPVGPPPSRLVCWCRLELGLWQPRKGTLSFGSGALGLVGPRSISSPIFAAAIAGWSPTSWLLGTSRCERWHFSENLKVTMLVATQQGPDRLASEISKRQVQGEGVPRRRATH